MIDIKNEDDLISVVNQIWYESEGNVDDIQIRFVGWPTVKFKIKGRDFRTRDSGVDIPIRFVPALIALQLAMTRLYSRAIGRPGVRRTKIGRINTDLIVTIGPGSANFNTTLMAVLNSALRNMSGKQKLTAIVVIAVLGSGLIGWSLYLEDRKNARWDQTYRDIRSREIGVLDRLTETQRHLAIAVLEIISSDTEAKCNVEDYYAALDAVLRSMDDDDVLYVDGNILLDGKAARILLQQRTPRTPPIHEWMEGDFEILRVYSDRARNGHQVRVRYMESNEKFTADVVPRLLPPDQLEVLKDSEWEKAIVRMRIRVQRLSGRIVSATLVRVGNTDNTPETFVVC